MHPLDVAWSHLDVNAELPPLTAEGTPAQWQHAFNTRRDMLHLFQGPLPFFTLPRNPQYLLQAVDDGLLQSQHQLDPKNWNRAGFPRGKAMAQNMIGTFTAENGARRPFGMVMSSLTVLDVTGSYIHNIAARMLKSAKRPDQGNLTLYLLSKHFHDLDPLRRAAGLLAAKAYEEWIKAEAIRQGHQVNWSLGHHLPALTSRQARRSAISEQELRRSSTADELAAIPQGRLMVLQCRQMILLSTAVIRCLLPDQPGSAPLFEIELTHWLRARCEQVLQRDQSKMEELAGKREHSYAFSTVPKNASFLLTFTSPRDVSPHNQGVPFVRIMFDPQIAALVHSYISDVVSRMMRGATRQEHFSGLLWATIRDWDSCSAWTRGKALLQARAYKNLAAWHIPHPSRLVKLGARQFRRSA
ncbi:hypothetical protein BCR35DRAFT_315373 [Leucosporidium creatinivorum]|uniref:Uncharacterized protein n=1 Tax=Leucosporidium creatinivorum TaxID=106004 RepID=A0A1Y2E929_9BASI|nr:hypothetical protein BCR35DRAFT_315373 [Leucosporidium creatinivorum]